MDANFWRRAACFGIPFGGDREQFAVGIAAGDVGHYGRRKCGRFVDLAAALGDGAVVGEFAQNALQLDAVDVLQAGSRSICRGAILRGFARMKATMASRA